MNIDNFIVLLIGVYRRLSVAIFLHGFSGSGSGDVAQARARGIGQAAMRRAVFREQTDFYSRFQ
jgi:hypothetical protein